MKPLPLVQASVHQGPHLTRDEKSGCWRPVIAAVDPKGKKVRAVVEFLRQTQEAR